MNTLTLKELEKLGECHRNATAPLHGMEDTAIIWMTASKWFGQLLSLARRQLEQQEGLLGSPEGVRPPVLRVDSSSADVPPLGEGELGDLFCKDASGQAFWMEVSHPDGVRISDVVLRRDQVRSLIAHLQSWLSHGSFELKPASPVTNQPLGEKVDPGEGWRLLEEGEYLQEGDGFLMPNCSDWISYECRPDIFRGSKATGCPVKDYAHTWPWRRRVDVS